MIREHVRAVVARLTEDVRERAADVPPARTVGNHRVHRTDRAREGQHRLAARGVDLDAAAGRWADRLEITAEIERAAGDRDRAHRAVRHVEIGANALRLRGASEGGGHDESREADHAIAICGVSHDPTSPQDICRRRWGWARYRRA